MLLIQRQNEYLYPVPKFDLKKFDIKDFDNEETFEQLRPKSYRFLQN